VATLEVKRDEAARFARMLCTEATSDGSLDQAKIDRFVEVTPAILGDEKDTRRRPLVQRQLRKAVLNGEDLSLSGDPADRAKSSRGLPRCGPLDGAQFVREWRASVDETDNYVSAGAL